MSGLRLSRQPFIRQDFILGGCIAEGQRKCGVEGEVAWMSGSRESCKQQQYWRPSNRPVSNRHCTNNNNNNNNNNRVRMVKSYAISSHCFAIDWRWIEMSLHCNPSAYNRKANKECVQAWRPTGWKTWRSGQASWISSLHRHRCAPAWCAMSRHPLHRSQTGQCHRHHQQQQPPLLCSVVQPGLEQPKEHKEAEGWVDLSGMTKWHQSKVAVWNKDTWHFKWVLRSKFTILERVVSARPLLPRLLSSHVARLRTQSEHECNIITWTGSYGFLITMFAICMAGYVYGYRQL